MAGFPWKGRIGADGSHSRMKLIVNIHAIVQGSFLNQNHRNIISLTKQFWIFIA